MGHQIGNVVRQILVYSFRSWEKSSERQTKHRMDGNTACIDSCNSRRRNYNVFFLGFFYKIVEKCSLSGSCFSSEDYVCRLSAVIADKLISTFREEKSAKQKYVLIPKRMSIPIVRDNDGNARCQYDFNFITEVGILILKFESHKSYMR